MVRNNLLTDVAGLKVGHATDLNLGSGVTVVVFDTPAVASGLVLGGAPGGRDTALLDPAMSVERVDAFVLSGGSAFGLDAAGGVAAGLREDGRGLAVGPTMKVPIVPQAILMDLNNGGDKAWSFPAPYLALGLAAYRAAGGGAFALGSVGAGTGATTANLKGGIGSASLKTPDGDVVAALMAVNAVGSATIGDSRHFWAWPFEDAAEFGGWGGPPEIRPGDLWPRLKGAPATGTTIGIVATDATLSKAQAHRLSIAAHDGLVRAVLPAHLPHDGDTLFAAATGRGGPASPHRLITLCQAATLVTARAVARGVYEACRLPYAAAQQAWHDRFGIA
jgi:L-aminopeptidase/D-esterase-like protein